MKNRSYQDLLAERRANVQEIRREKDATAVLCLWAHVAEIDAEIERRLGLAKTVLDIETEKCWVCGRPINEGDEPGHVPMDNGVMVPICSVACTELHFADSEAS